MPLRDLRDLLALLRRENEVIEIDAEVDPRLELAEVHRRVAAAGGPALLFRRVKGSPHPVTTNLFGTKRRVDMAFGDRPLAFVKSAASIVHTLVPPTLGRLWNARGFLRDGLRIGLSHASRGPVTERCVDPPRLTELPFLQLWPDDGGDFITLPMVYTQHPTRGEGNLGMYRIQRYDDATTGMHWQIGKGGGFHYAEAEALDRPLPVTISVGGPPALILSAIAPLPEGVTELLLASMLLGEKLAMVRDARSPYALAARAEFVLVGEVRPRERRPEGPFGDHYGYYSLRHDYPVFHCARVFHRRDAIWPATIVGKPRQEDFYLGEYLQTLLSPLFPLVMPAVRDLWSYGETGFHSLSAAVVHERYPREALASAFRILGEGQLSLTKFLLVTDTPMDLRDFRAVFAHVLSRVNWETDLYVFSNASMDTLDYAGPEVNKGSKGVILALGDAKRVLPERFEGTLPAGIARVEVFAPGALVLEAAPYVTDRNLPARIARHADFAPWPFIAVVDDARAAARSVPAFLWHVFTRFEPANDLHARGVRVQRHHLVYSGPVVFDSRMKPWYPKVVEAGDDTAATVTRRWKEYFPEGTVVMGDSHLAHV